MKIFFGAIFIILIAISPIRDNQQDLVGVELIHPFLQ